MLVGGVISLLVVVLTSVARTDDGPAPARWTLAAASPRAAVSAATGAAPGEPAGAAEVVDSGPAPLHASTEWVARVASATGIAAVAVRAYAAATLTLARDSPRCRVGWTTLAGIGAVESGHGTHAGAVLLDDGRPSVPVIGPALDGSNGTAPIRASPQDIAWTQDPTWAHAVGPMQFLPSTWRRWASDGDGDGVSDPNDLDDAALAAGRYLCASGGNLASGAGWHLAVASYNHDDSYVALVLATADRYAGLAS
ncbi:lytic transglycosylase domain-containing protein [Cellulomonas sp. URHD0024]|uniref:lytic transglycosylase domain-containing protein n=1 Tax=Cellulomonas sp. URHD0024 TaxID=1302620 RepID=UPI0004290313|nr:lytic transglycosylase domain-containing protein [Cellulomonas sp. URHD0024]